MQGTGDGRQQCLICAAGTHSCWAWGTVTSLALSALLQVRPEPLCGWAARGDTGAQAALAVTAGKPDPQGFSGPVTVPSPGSSAPWLAPGWGSQSLVPPVPCSPCGRSPCRPLGRSMVFTSSSAMSKAFRPLSFFSQKSCHQTHIRRGDSQATRPHSRQHRGWAGVSV